MIQKIVKITSLICLSTSLASAASLIDFKDRVGASAGVRSLDESNQIEKIESLLTARAEITDKQKSALKVYLMSYAERHFESASMLREVADEGASVFMREWRYGKPMSFDPSKFSYEIEAEIQQKNDRICYQVLDRRSKPITRNYKGFVIGSINDLIDNFHQNVVLPELKRKSKSSTKSKEGNNEDLLNLIDQVLSYAPGNRKGQTIQDVLGTAFDVKIYEKDLNKIYFTKEKILPGLHKDMLTDDKKISLSLSLLAGIRSGNDQYFIETEECFLRYMKAMQADFRFLKQENEKGVFSGFFSSKSETEQEVANREKRVERFLDGTEEDQEVFIEKMLKVLKQSIPVLEEKLAGAKVANSLVGNLSKEQMDYLISFFIEANRSNLPSAEDIFEINAAMPVFHTKYSVPIRDKERELRAFNASSVVTQRERKLIEEIAKLKAQLNPYMADYQYYVDLSRSLGKLEETLRIEKADQQSLVEELRKVKEKQ